MPSCFPVTKQGISNPSTCPPVVGAGVLYDVAATSCGGVSPFTALKPALISQWLCNGTFVCLTLKGQLPSQARSWSCVMIRKIAAAFETLLCMARSLLMEVWKLLYLERSGLKFRSPSNFLHHLHPSPLPCERCTLGSCTILNKSTSFGILGRLLFHMVCDLNVLLMLYGLDL